jgi:hypothetical protein
VYFSQIHAEKRIIIYMLPMASESSNLGQQERTNRWTVLGSFWLGEPIFIGLRMVFKPKMGIKLWNPPL